MSFTPISEVGEFGLIARIERTLGPAAEGARLTTGIGDDAAVLDLGGDRAQVVTTDLLVEGVHFDRTFAPLRALGWKAVAVNVSDVCAMNATPQFVTVSLGLPNNVSVEGVEAFYVGVREACERYGVAVVGGDIAASARMTVALTAIGEAPAGRIVTRGGAEPGDLLCVTGDVGSAAAGLRILLQGKAAMEAGDGGDGAPGEAPPLSAFAYAVERQLQPQARLDRVAAWAEAGFRPTSLIDISDGVASEVHHLCRQSATGAVVEAGLLPIHVQTALAAQQTDGRPEALALYGGEDYELLFTAPEPALSALAPDSFAVVGQMVEPDEGIALRLGDGETVPLDAEGFRHF